MLKSFSRRFFTARPETLPVSVLFVCMANYCRSPMAEGLLTQHLLERGLSKRIGVDSAGTHVGRGGQRPDARAQQVVFSSGVDIGRLRSRPIAREDFELFDYILAMDEGNLQSLSELCPAEHRHKLAMIMSFAPQAGVTEVPDPYYSSKEGFRQVYTFLRQAVVGLVASIEETHDMT